MENIDIIFKRASIRKFLDKPVSKELIHQILDAGFAAPSALNLRPYHFIYIDDKNILRQISVNSRFKKLLADAPCAIAVVADSNINYQMEFLLNDTSACIQNMLLAIHGLGLGGVWLGQKRSDDEGLNKILQLPEGMFVAGTIAFGYPNETKEQKDRYNPSKVHHNKF